jgi:hypothetical protein
MKKIVFFLILLIIILLSQIKPAAGEEADKITTRRFAFVIGANNGGAGPGDPSVCSH